MKIQIYSRCTQAAGSFLMVALVVVGIIAALIIGSLALVQSQNVAIARSQAWNECIPVIEAGIEEAMAHLNNHADTNLTSDGWALQNGVYTMQPRNIGGGYYVVGIVMTNDLRPVIICTGYVALPAAAASAPPPAFAAAGVPAPNVKYLSRTVRTVCEKTQLYIKAMVSREQIEMKGNQINTDSFDSSDPNFSTPDGRYDPTRIKDNGDVATLLGIADAIGYGNANIKGHVRTGPGGGTTGGPNGIVGSLQWHATVKSGVQPGWITHDMNMSFRDVELPFKNSPLIPTPLPNVVNGVSYKYVLTNGNYRLNGLAMSSSDRMLVLSNCVLLVNGNLDISGTAAIDIGPSARLQIYMAGATASIGGTGVNNTGLAANFMYWGLPANTTLAMKSSGEFTGVIYAPNADLKMSGGGSSVQNYVGACIVKSVVFNGHFNYHYDEALGKFGPPADFIIVSWTEI